MIEPLDTRIAPASVVTLTLTNGDLQISADNGGAQIEVEQLPSGEWVFRGTDTTFVIGSEPATALAFLKEVKGDVSISLGAGSDQVVFDGVKLPGDLTISGAGGSNTTQLLGSTVRGDLNINGGSTGDQLAFNGAKVSGDVNFQAGDGPNALFIFGAGFSGGGDLTFVGGSGSDQMLFFSGAVKVAKNLSVDGGPGGASNFQLSSTQLTVGGNLVMRDGNVASNLTISPAGLLKVSGLVQVVTGGGADTVEIANGTARAILGSVLVDDSASPELNTAITITPSSLLQVKGSVTLTHTFDTARVTIRADVVRIGGDLISTASATPGGQLILGAATSFSVGGNMNLSGGNAAYRLTVNVPATFRVGGDFTASGGSTSASFDFAVGTMRVGGDLNLSSNAIDMAGSLSGGAVTVGGTFAIESTSRVSSFGIGVRSMKVGGDFVASSFTGFGSLVVDVAGAWNVGGPVSISSQGGGGDEVVDITVGGGRIGGNIDVTLVDASATVSVISDRTPLAIKGNSFFGMVSQATSVVTIQGLATRGSLSVSGILGDDTVNLDDVTVMGLMGINSGEGTDTVNIERMATVLRRGSTFSGDVSIVVSAANPGIVNVGLADDARYRATFTKGAEFMAGAGLADVLVLANAVFKQSGQPVVTGFETVS
jgi:hypothetical protein